VEDRDSDQRDGGAGLRQWPADIEGSGGRSHALAAERGERLLGELESALYWTGTCAGPVPAAGPGTRCRAALTRVAPHSNWSRERDVGP
jgi:hypothetical protein